MIRITCPHCTQNIEAADEWAGRKVDCPGCAGKFIVPPLATADHGGRKPKHIIAAGIAAVLAATIGTIYFAMRDTSPKPAPQAATQTAAETPPIFIPTIIELPELPPPLPKTAAERIRDGLDTPISPTKELDKILSDLALKEPLEVPDFKELRAYSLNGKPENILIRDYFIKIFGKPDSEYTHMAQYQPTKFHAVQHIHVEEFTFLKRVWNSTTEKKEDVTVVFHGGYFARAETPSGHRTN